jgi:hypothetical protein
MDVFPIEIVNTILEYSGYHVYRHGKFMKRISETDDRVKMISSMKKIKKNVYGTYEVCFWKTITSVKPVVYKKREACFIIETHILSSCVMWVMNISYYYDHNDSYEDRQRIQFILN